MDQEILRKPQIVKLMEEEDESTMLDEEDVCRGVEDCLHSCMARDYMISKNILSVCCKVTQQGLVN